MQKVLTKIVCFLVLAALVVSPVAAAVPERVMPPTDGPVISAEEQEWLEMAKAADSFTIQLAEPSLAAYEPTGNAIFAAIPRDESGKLDVDAPEAIAYLAHVNAGLDAFIAEAEAVLGRDLEVLYRYDYVLNGFSARMSVEEAALLRQLPGVKEVFVDEIYQLDTDVSPEFIGVDQVWNGNATPAGEGAKGAGTIVGVLDTGINLSHPSFAQTTPLDPYVYTNPYGNGVFKGLCATNPSTHTCNNKLIGVYDMTGGGNGHDQEDHGSHTASTSAGNRIQVSYGGASVVISGMAPNAHIIAYKVCVVGGGCATPASTAAVNQAIADGVDSMNFSIGPQSGPARSPWADSTEVAFLEAFKVGISTATSAGNSGPGDSTIYKLPPWALVVGNTQHGRIFGYPVLINPTTDALDSIAILASSDLAPALGVDLVGKDLVWGGNLGDKFGCAAFPAGSMTGKVGIVQRGDCTFKEKLQFMQDAGAIFGLVYNNAPGAPIIMGTDTGAVTIPGAMISLEAGLEMEAVAGSPMTVNINKTLSSGTRPSWGDIIADSSSRGPITNFEMLEPDLVAPGTNILAAYDGPGEIDLMSGTSMAGPHVAGSTAVMRSLFPTWTPAAIRSAIIMTALAGTSVDHDLSPVTPFIYGNGRIDMSKAALAGLVMEETYANYKAANPATGGDIRTLNIPSYQNSNCMGGCTFTRTVKNVAGVATDYTIAIEATAGVDVTTSPANAFTIPAGGTQVITVNVNPNIASGGEWQFARIAFETEDTFASGKPISTTAFTLAAKADVSGSTLPKELQLDIDQATGQYVFEDQYNAEPITALSNVRYGLTPATVVEFELAQDPTNGDPYDNQGAVWVGRTTCPSGSQRMVVEILETTANDLDVFVGIGSTPHVGLQKASSTEPGPMEYLNIFQPSFSGSCWILVQNWESSEPGAIDPIKLAYGFVPKTTSTNYTITGPASVPALNPFDLTVNWNLGASFDANEVWYGWFSIGTTALKKDDVGKLDFNLYKVAAPEPILLDLFLPLITRP
ncbi:MAG: S8 family serine peptidase [Anaerolineaceae bacterium]|nr:S8 family serine peptidase [Anaerolineaceae bacterium]